MSQSMEQTMQVAAPEDAVSALTDGELSGTALTEALAQLREDPLARQRWQVYHLIGEAMRSPSAVVQQGECSLLMTGLRQRLWQNARTDGERAPVAAVDPVMLTPPLSEPVREAANDSRYRWKLVAGLASLATVMVGAWALMAGQTQPPAPSMAAASPAQASPVSAGPMFRDRQLDELMAAHRQRGGSSALQNPAGFLRNATFTVSAP